MSGAAGDEIPLGFLTPSNRPDSLGRIGHYEVLQVLGHGGFGIVFRAFDDVLQRVVAVKVLAPQLAATSPARKRFLREARTSGAIRHENVVQVYEVGEEPLPYLVMEFIPGETLQHGKGKGRDSRIQCRSVQSGGIPRRQTGPGRLESDAPAEPGKNDHREDLRAGQQCIRCDWHRAQPE